MTNAELDMAWKIVEQTGANLFLTGKAGTGKTTFLKNLRKKGTKRMVVLAPTGIAAINAGGTTIHSFFQLPLSPYLPGTTFEQKDRKFFQFGKVKRNIIRTLDLLVIDEISMVRADLLDAIDSVMRRYREHDKPFGGAQLLMIGDLQQLAPVIKDREWAMLSAVYDTPYFFSSKALNKAQYHTVELKTVYRQQDTSFIELLNDIRENRATDETLERLNRRYIPNFNPGKDNDYIRLTTHNLPAQQINEHELDMLPAKAFHFDAEVEGNFPEASYPAEQRLTLKQGAQIMFIKNDPEKRFFNGMIGEVVSVDNRSIIVRGKGKSQQFQLEQAEWENSKYTLNEKSKEITETVEGVFKQFPVRLAWAITIHKSQGLTFDHAIIDVSKSFAHGQTYVALSRCRTLEGLVLSEPLQRSSIKSDSVLEEFISDINAKTPTGETISALHRAYIIRILDELFDFKPLKTAYAQVLRTIDEHLYRKFAKTLAEYKRLEPEWDNLIDVAAKFKPQYTKICLETGGVSSPLLQDRVHKAAGYFLKGIEPLYDLCRKTKITTENKVVKKQYEERFEDFSMEIKLKRSLLLHESQPENAFSTESYLKLKASLLLSSDDAPAKAKKRKPASTADRQTSSDTKKTARKSKSETEQKPHKVTTREVSYEMFNSGMSIEDIARERGLQPNTIFSHLASFVAEGRMDYRKLMPEAHFNEIDTYIRHHPNTQTITEIKEAVSQDITFSEIRLVCEVRKAK